MINLHCYSEQNGFMVEMSQEVEKHSETSQIPLILTIQTAALTQLIDEVA
jgi:hypothetical protein